MVDDVFFEGIYRGAGRDRDRLGWTRSGPDSVLVAWLDREPPAPGRAMVVACGVGDDAEHLASHGWDVTAFDVAPTAIEWCRERFPDSPVDYRVADLFELPEQWRRAFDLVVEVWTLQSIPPEQMSRAIDSIAELVAHGGTLLVSSLTSVAAPSAGPPWPVHPEALNGFVAAGLVEMKGFEHNSPYPRVGAIEVEYRRP